jgi:uncharacterized protein (DUF488 family)
MLFTIGHSNLELASFLANLVAHDIAAVLDVRSSPFSRRFPHFNRARLEMSLRESRIDYRFVGDELGEPEAYEGERARYELIRTLPAFRRGIAEVMREASIRRVALMCAEEDPITCHRMILINPELRGMPIQHIRRDGRVESHADAERRLVEATKSVAGGLFANGESAVGSAYEAQAERLCFRRTPAGP